MALVGLAFRKKKVVCLCRERERERERVCRERCVCIQRVYTERGVDGMRATRVKITSVTFFVLIILPGNR